MKGTPDDMLAVAKRLGVCEVATSSRNWSTLHDANLILLATMPPVLAKMGHLLHGFLDEAFKAATFDPMEAENPDWVCVVRLDAPTFISLVACIDKVQALHGEGRLELIGPDGAADMMLNQMTTARVSFYEYLRSRQVGAEILLGDE